MDKMTKIKQVIAATFLAVGSSMALAIPYGTVGGVDLFLQQTHLADSGDATSELWAESVVGGDLTFDAKYNGTFPWSAVTGDPAGTNLYAMLLDPSVDYFLIKTGNLAQGNPQNTPNAFLFQNINNLNYAVVDLAHFGTSFSLQIGKFSHTNVYSNPTTSVPEPGSMAILAAGLLGLVASRRITRKV